MESTRKFGPKEQTREQRQALMDQAAAINATQDRKLSAFGQQLSEQYVAGDLTLAEVNERLDRYYQVQAAPKRVVDTEVPPAH